MSAYYIDSLILPEVAFSDCMPEMNESEISYVFVARKNAKPLSDWTSKGEWLWRLLMQGNEADIIRKLTIIGSIDTPSLTTVKISGSRTKDADSLRTLVINIDESTQNNYDFSRFTEAEINVRLWYGSKGGKLFGGNNGIIGKLKIFPLYASGTGNMETYSGSFVWHSQISPKRIDNPLAGMEIKEANIQFLLTDGQGNYVTDGNSNYIKVQN